MGQGKISVPYILHNQDSKVIGIYARSSLEYISKEIEMKALYNIKEQIGNRLYGTFKIPIHFITLSTDELECICIPQQKFIKLY